MESKEQSFLENWFDQHDITGPLVDKNGFGGVIYDELVLQFLNNEAKLYVYEWAKEEGVQVDAINPCDFMPQKAYMDLIVDFRSSQLRIDSYNKWLENRIPSLPKPEYGEDCEKH